jgi:hypothetical protein
MRGTTIDRIFLELGRVLGFLSLRAICFYTELIIYRMLNGRTRCAVLVGSPNDLLFVSVRDNLNLQVVAIPRRRYRVCLSLEVVQIAMGVVRMDSRWCPDVT